MALHAPTHFKSLGWQPPRPILRIFEHEHFVEIFNAAETPPVHPIAELDNVILTPHVSGLSVQASEEVSITGVHNVVSVLSGHLPLADNIVNRDVEPRFPLTNHDPSLFEPRS